MYLSLIVLFKMTLLAVFYFISLVFLWPYFGISVTLLGLFPLIVLVVFFASSLFHYVVVLIFTVLSLYAIGVPLVDLFYSFHFLGIQAGIISIGLSWEIVQSQIRPHSKQQVYHNITKLFSKNYPMTMVFDPVLQTIVSMTRAASKMYGWKQNELIGKSVSLIYHHNIFEDPPKDFWETLQKGEVWHGFSEIVIRNQYICEERAYYTGTQNEKGDLTLIEKNIIEVILKEKIKPQHDAFYQLYENNPIPMGIINKAHIIEGANREFIRNSVIKPIINKNKFYELFNEKMRGSILAALNGAFDGNKESFVESWNNIRGRYEAKYIFTPYYNHKLKEITHVLFLLSLQHKALAQQQEPLVLSHRREESMIIDLLRDGITAFYQKDAQCILRLFGQSLPSVLVEKNQWSSFIEVLLTFTNHHSVSVETKNIVVQCSSQAGYYYFNVIFEQIPYEKIAYCMTTLEYQQMVDQISNISIKYSFEKGTKDELVLFFTYYDTETIV